MYELILEMIIHKGYQALKLTNPVVTLGIFDGVHIGHIAILNRLIASARENNGDSVVITFDPHPKMVLDTGPENLSFLSTLDEKQELLAKAGAGHLIIINFTLGFSSIPAVDFVKNILLNKIGTRKLIVGHDHHFGYRGGGDYNSIREYARKKGILMEQVGKLEIDGVAVSSSGIRDALLAGRLDLANRWLGYSYSLKGVVVKGRKLGRELGFPTANLELCDKNKLVPANGVYAVEVREGETIMPGMLSIGTNPTINRDSEERSIEVHIFNFAGEIYGSELRIIFRKRLRDEMRFENIDELIRQIRIDRDNSLKVLG